MASAWDTRPPGVTPSLSEIADQIDVLTATANANGLPSSLAVLKRNLEQFWQPDASVLLQAGSITTEMLAPIEGVRYIGAAGQPAFAGAWANFSAVAAPPAGGGPRAGFWKDREGIVRMSGIVKSGVSGTSVVTLPSDYAPGSNDHTFVVIASGGCAAAAIGPSGTVTLTNFTAGAAVATFCYLDGIAFRAAT